MLSRTGGPSRSASATPDPSSMVKQRASPPAHADTRLEAGDLEDGDNVNAASAVAFSAYEDQRALQKIDRRILPLILLAYLFQQLDKSTLMYASVFGIMEDAHLVDKQFAWLGSILYIAQLLAQPLAAATLVKFPLGKVIAIAVFLWGATLCIMSRCTTFHGLLVMRFLLGAFESIIAPSLMAVSQLWWKREDQTLRISYWNGMNGVAPIVGGLLSYVLGHIKSDSLYQYQVIFLASGLFTIAFSVPVWRLMPDHPSEADFLNDDEKAVIMERLRNESAATKTADWQWSHVRESTFDPKTWLWVLMYTVLAIPSGGLGMFGSLIIKDFGFDGFQTILMNIPVGVLQLGSYYASASLATKLNRKGPVIGLLCIPAVVGILMLLAIPHTAANRGILLFAYYTIVVFPSIQPLMLAWQAQNTAGDTKKKWNTGLIFGGMCFGNIVGPLFYDPRQAPLYQTGLFSSLCMFITLFGLTMQVNHSPPVSFFADLVTSLTSAYLMSLNRGRRRGRYSKVSSAGEASTLQGFGIKDLTDLENREFEYVL